jgi:hypothetical protein
MEGNLCFVRLSDCIGGHVTFNVTIVIFFIINNGNRWTFEKAAKLLEDNTPLNKIEIHQEIRRYITWPGQVCCHHLFMLSSRVVCLAAQ